MIAANAMFEVLADEKTVQSLYEENKTLFEKVRDAIEKFFSEIKKIIRDLGKKWEEVEALREDQQTLETIRAMFDSVMWKTEQNNKNTVTQDGEVKYNIKKGMSEEERLNELKKYKLMPVPVDYEKLNGVNLEDIANTYKRNASKILTDLAKKFGVFKIYTNAEIQLEFYYGSNRLEKSLHSQDNNYDSFAKMLSCFDKLVESAVPIEIHGEKQKRQNKIDKTLKNVYVLINAIKDSDGIIPVQFEIKEFFDSENVLYLSVALNKTEANVLGLTPTVNGDDNGPRLTSEYSIADILSKINPKDENLLKYVPDGLLDDERKQAKQHALEKDAKKYGIFEENGENNSPKKSLKSRDDEYLDEDNQDIRFSLKERQDVIDAHEKLLRENDKLREANQILKEELSRTDESIMIKKSHKRHEPFVRLMHVAR